MKLLLNKAETCDAVSLSVSKINKMIADNRFPKPVKIGGNVRWKQSDLQEWVDKLVSNEIPGPSKKRGRPRLAV